MSTKHTKGPWINDGGNNNSIDIVLPNNTTISIDRQCRYSGKYVIKREEMQANASLIAASPEMLEMLKKARMCMKLLVAGKCTIETASKIADEIKHIIQKATTI